MLVTGGTGPDLGDTPPGLIGQDNTASFVFLELPEQIQNFPRDWTHLEDGLLPNESPAFRVFKT